MMNKMQKLEPLARRYALVKFEPGPYPFLVFDSGTIYTLSLGRKDPHHSFLFHIFFSVNGDEVKVNEVSTKSTCYGH